MSLALTVSARLRRPLEVWPGIALASGLAVLATVGGENARIVGAPVLALALGVVVCAAVPLGAEFAPGLAFAARMVLQVAVVTSGFGISLVAVARTGLATLPVTLVSVAVALLGAAALGPLFGVSGTLRRLIGIGTAICGASAIAAVTEAAQADVALAMTTIFLYNVAAVLIFPPLGHLMGLSQSAFGTWAGSAVNDTSSVVAAGYAYGPAAGAHATIVKLGRATLILPVVGALAVARVLASRGRGVRVPWRSIVPWFVGWFVLATAANGAGLVPVAWHDGIGDLATYLIAVALAAIGLQTDLGRLRAAGARPLALGLVLWIGVAAASLAVAHAVGS